MMRWRGVSHVEFAALGYDDSIAFYDAMFGWLGYDSFSSLNMEYQSIYYFTRYLNPHSYIGIQPARVGCKLTHADQAVGINHVALWARSRAEVDQFHRDLLIPKRVPALPGVGVPPRTSRVHHAAARLGELGARRVGPGDA
jgi:catechol 2,3-dioxygenase-like lactoylglutathione lyase family enzyme